MKPVDETVPRITQDGLALILGGRTYGKNTNDDNYGRLLQMGVPSEMDALSDALVSASRLLGLPGDSSRAGIYEAYGHDLGLMARYRDAFRTCIEAAVRARAAPDQKDARAFLDRVVAELTPILHQPTLNLGPESLSLEPAALLAKLQDEFRADVLGFKQTVAVWFHVLTESEYVSLIEWLNPTSLRYYFFRTESTREQIAKHVDRSGNWIEGITTTTTTKTRVQLFNERRSHTLVKARIQTPEQYRARVPKRIALLIESIPAEIRPFVRIIDGHVTHEEVQRRLTSNKVEVETHSVYRPDPALVLFNAWAINGWGGSIQEESRSIYAGHPLARANKILVGSLLATATTALLVEPFGGVRASLLVAAVGLILTALNQAGLRLEMRKSA
jgi:hypothetical protein